MTETEKAYLAGILDGEGHIHLATKTDGRVHCYVSVANNRPELHAWLTERWPGGYLNSSKNEACIVTKWQSKESVEALLRDAYPYLVLKQVQAGLALLYWHESLGRGRRSAVPEEELANMLLAMEEEHLKGTGAYQLSLRQGSDTCQR